MGWRNYGKGITETCYECPDRYLGCHDHCGKYQDAKKAWTDLQKKNRDEKRKYLDFYSHHVDAVIKMKRKEKQ